ncbi:MAG: VWA domain-containing protein [Actinomycetota bacterium]|nr:VWA domain-containing protein [Actinomycetota bacterium]
MRRTRALVPLLVAALAALAAPAAATAQRTELTPLHGARFPDRAYVLTLPSRLSLDESSVAVRENGELVSDVSLIPAGAQEAGRFAVVLVIDASNSMRGEPIREALAAARAFAARRSENQAVAILAFNSESGVLVPFTTDDQQIADALATAPTLSQGTHIYDGVDAALTLIEEAKVTGSSIIVLSDGADTGSRADVSDVIARAGRSRVRIFSVGLRSRSFEPAPLVRLADEASGRYSEAASADDLERIFDELGTLLAHEYVLRYRSSAGPELPVKVAVSVEGIDGIAVSEYLTPAAPPGSGPFHRSLGERFLHSGAGMIATSVVVALLVGAAFAALVRPRTRTLRARMAEFVSLSIPERTKGGARTDVVLAHAEKRFARTRWWSRVKDELEIAGIGIPAIQIVLVTLVATVIVAGLLFLAAGSLAVLLALGVPIAARSLIKRKLARQRRLFADQLPDNLQVISSALRAGHSLVGALSVLVDDCPEPSRGEFRRVIADEQLGVPLESGLEVVANRMENRDLEQVGLVAALQRETGGNTAEVLDRVADTIRSRAELRRLVKTLTAQGRMSRWVVSLLPVGLLVVISAMNPRYVAPLFEHSAGRGLLVTAAILVVAGSVVIKRIVDIKV